MLQVLILGEEHKSINNISNKRYREGYRKVAENKVKLSKCLTSFNFWIVFECYLHND